MKNELVELLEKEYNGVENYIQKDEEGIMFKLSFSKYLNLGDTKSHPFFIVPNPSSEYIFDSMFELHEGDIIIDGYLSNDLKLTYTFRRYKPNDTTKFDAVITTDVTRLYTNGPDKAFERYTLPDIMVYIDNLVKYIECEEKSIEYNEVSKFVFEELKYKYKVV